MRRAKVYMHDALAGTLIEDEEGYTFLYDPEYLKHSNAPPVSLSLPKTSQPYKSKTIENIFAKFQSSFTQWKAFIDISFLPDAMKEKYKELIVQKATQIALEV